MKEQPVILTGRAGATVVRRNTDAEELVQSSNARAGVEADISAV